MAADRKVMFPRYVGRPKLFFVIERDEVFVPSSMALIVITWGLISAVELYLLMPVVVFIWIVVFKVYRWYKSQATPGLIEHYLYTLGLRMPYGKSDLEKDPSLEKLLKIRRLVPEGFEVDFYS